MTANDDFGMGGFLLETDRAPSGVELDDAVALRIADLIPKNGCAAILRRGALQRFGKSRAVEDIVAKRQRDRARCQRTHAR